MGPSRSELPVGVPLALAVARNDRAALVVGPIQVYSDGFEIDAHLLVRDDADAERGRYFFDPFTRHHGQDTNGILRLAFVFSDGTSIEAIRAFEGNGERTLVPQGGNGGQGRWSTSFWSWPLPPPGPIEVLCAWPLHGIAETRAAFDAGTILEAAAKVERLWPEPSDEDDHSTSHIYFSAGD